jgi:hypothetical protein
MDCIITVKGNGVGKYGHSKNDRTGPLKDFLVDNQVLYLAVTKHLQGCSTCSIEAVLREYLRRRVEIPKFKGGMSSSLPKRALILEKLAKKKGQPVPRELVNEFLWRSGVYGVIEHYDRLSVRERFQAFQLDRYLSASWPKLHEADKYLYELAGQGLKGDLTNEELEELVQVAEVQLS